MPHYPTPDHTIGERIVWTLLLGVATGVAAYGARRLAAWVWTQTRASHPPKAIGVVETFAKKVGSGALKGLGA